MRIVTLLPSLTELVAELGHASELVGITHECDFPESIAHLPRLTRSRIDPSASGVQIDAEVAARAGSLYELDCERLGDLGPDLILTQSQCDVCAVNEGIVRRAAASLRGSPHVESVNPTDLAGVFAMFERIGGLLGATAREVAKRLVAGFGVTSTEIARRVGSRPPARIAHLEWIDPPYVAGHWIPELIARAGGCDVMGRPGRPSVRTTWQAIREAAPELMLAAPCGLPIDRARRELDILLENPGVRQAPWTTRPRIALSDGNAYFSRPGPRLESSMRIAAAAMCPELCGDLAPEGGWVEYSPRA